MLTAIGVFIAAATPQAVTAQPVTPSSTQIETIAIGVGRSFPIDLGAAVTQVTIANPEVADVVVLTERSVVINAKAAGETDVLLAGAALGRRHLRVTVFSAVERRQIALAVKFAEVRRDFLTELGVSARGTNRTGDGTQIGGTGVLGPDVANAPPIGSSLASRFLSGLATWNTREIAVYLSAQEQRLACFNVGSALRTIHALPVDGQKVTASGWSDFLGVQLRGCVERQERLGLDAAIVRQIDSFLARVDLHERDRQVFLHTEVMRDHVFFERSARSLAFSGFIDFEPSMIGCAEYDFAAVGIFLSCGDAHALRAFFAGYGSLPAVNSREFRRRIMAYTLLHKYSNLCWYLEFMPRASSLDELADLWWAV